MKSSMIKSLAGAVLAIGAVVATPAQAAKLCVWDVMGASGDVFTMMKDYSIEAKKWGVNFDLKPYTDEKIAAEDLKAGQCDGVVMTGMRGRQFNPFTGSLDSIGGIPSYKAMGDVIATLAKPGAAKFMSNGNYEVVGIAPMGAAFLFVNDRSINNVSKLSGKKIAVLDYDKAQAKMVQKVGAQPVSSDVTNFAGKFNNGSVDIVGSPAAAFKPLELYKGLGTKGAIVRFPLAQLTIQIIVRKDRIPEGFGAKSRDYMVTRFDQALKMINKAEAEIGKQYWMDLPAADKEKYNIMLRDARISLTQEGIYDKNMMKILKRVRCQLEPSNAECAQNLE